MSACSRADGQKPLQLDFEGCVTARLVRERGQNNNATFENQPHSHAASLKCNSLAKNCSFTIPACHIISCYWSTDFFEGQNPESLADLVSGPPRHHWGCRRTLQVFSGHIDHEMSHVIDILQLLLP
jgi:hypothetical protein